jgi:hypothetical protein
MVDAYDSAREQGGDDFTDTLLPSELEAAKAGVYLPRAYFEHRVGRPEHEIDEMVAAYASEADD